MYEGRRPFATEENSSLSSGLTEPGDVSVLKAASQTPVDSALVVVFFCVAAVVLQLLSEDYIVLYASVVSDVVLNVIMYCDLLHTASMECGVAPLVAEVVLKAVL